MASAQKNTKNISISWGECRHPPPPKHLKYGIRSVQVISFTSQAIGLQLDIQINNFFVPYDLE